MRVRFGNGDSGFGRTMRAEVRPALDSSQGGPVAFSRWTPAKSGLYVRRVLSRRDFAKLVAASTVSAQLFNAGCDNPEEWSWILEILADVIKLVEAAVGKYEARNTGNSETDVEVTTSALREEDEAEVDSVTQVASVPSDGKTYEILTPDAENGGLMAPEPGKYLLRGKIPVADAVVYSSTYTVNA